MSTAFLLAWFRKVHPSVQGWLRFDPGPLTLYRGKGINSGINISKGRARGQILIAKLK
jgi:hypothetical protein